MVIPMFFYVDDKSYTDINSFPIIFKLGITGSDMLAPPPTLHQLRPTLFIIVIRVQLFAV
jgi:hypothetical protein